MGGGSSSSPSKPAAPAQLNYSDILNAANTGGSTQYQSELNALLGAYPQIQASQLGTIGKISNSITKSPLSGLSIGAALGGVAQGGNLNTLGNQFSGWGTQALSNSGPTTLENNLTGQANSNLSLGSSISPEDARTATQMANAGYAQNGFGNSAGAAATGILDRYNLGQERLQQRQGAAVQADNSVTGNTVARTGLALGALGQAGGAYGQAANIGYSGSAALTAANPYLQALSPGIALGSANLASTGGMVGGTWEGANQLSGDTASFNANLQASLWNQFYNSQASNQASSNSLTGAEIGAGGAVLGGVAIAI